MSSETNDFNYIFQSTKNVKMFEGEIDRIYLNPISYETMQNRAKYIVTLSTLNNPKSLEGTLYDPRAGTIERSRKCDTCRQDPNTCLGHFGLIKLNKPVIMPQFIGVLIKILKSIDFLVWKQNKDKHLIDFILDKDIIKSKFKSLKAEARLSAIVDNKYSNKKLAYTVTKSTKTELDILLKPKKGESYPIDVDELYEFLYDLTDDDLYTLGFSVGENRVHPKDFIFKGILVPPLPDRPYKIRNGMLQHDGITSILQSIVARNKDIDSTNSKKTKDAYEKMKKAINDLINADSSCTQRKGLPLKGIKAEIGKGSGQKKGLLNERSLGSRGDFSARTVIIPDPQIDYNEIGIPQKYADNIKSIREKITKFNIGTIKERIKMGEITGYIRVRKGKEEKMRFKFTTVDDRLEKLHNEEIKLALNLIGLKLTDWKKLVDNLMEEKKKAVKQGKEALKKWNVKYRRFNAKYKNIVTIENEIKRLRKLRTKYQVKRKEINVKDELERQLKINGYTYDKWLKKNKPIINETIADLKERLDNGEETFLKPILKVNLSGREFTKKIFNPEIDIQTFNIGDIV